MSEIDISEVEETIKGYYEKSREINRLQNKLALFAKNKQAVLDSIHECEAQSIASGPVSESLERELSDLELGIIEAAAAIRGLQRGIISVHCVIESLSDDERRFIELRYREGHSLSVVAFSLSMSKTTAYRYADKTLGKLRELLK